MMTTTLAETTIGGGALGGVLSWVTTFVVAAIGAIGAVFYGRRERERGRTEARTVSLTEPVATVPVQNRPAGPTWHQFEALLQRVDTHDETFRKMREELQTFEHEVQEQFRNLLVAGAERESRLQQSLAAQISTTARSTHERIDAVLLALRARLARAGHDDNNLEQGETA